MFHSPPRWSKWLPSRKYFRQCFSAFIMVAQVRPSNELWYFVLSAVEFFLYSGCAIYKWPYYYHYWIDLNISCLAILILFKEKQDTEWYLNIWICKLLSPLPPPPPSEQKKSYIPNIERYRYRPVRKHHPLKNEMEALITNNLKEYVWTNMWWYKFCAGNRLLIDIFGKLSYQSGLDRYRECTSTLNIWAYRPISAFFCELRLKYCHPKPLKEIFKQYWMDILHPKPLDRNFTTTGLPLPLHKSQVIVNFTVIGSQGAELSLEFWFYHHDHC